MNTMLRRLSVLLLAGVLNACGGGGDSPVQGVQATGELYVTVGFVKNPNPFAGPPTELQIYGVVRVESPPGATPQVTMEGFLDGQSLGALTQPNETMACDGMHGIACPSFLVYSYRLPIATVTGQHTLRWLVTGTPASGLRGDVTVPIDQNSTNFLSIGPLAFNA